LKKFSPNVLERLRILLVAALALGLSCCSKPDNRLVVGMELEYPPFETIDANGDPAGVSVDLAKALGEHLGKEVVIRDYKFKGLTAALSSGEIDLVISSMSANEKRAKEIDFSDPYAKTGLAMLVAKESKLTDGDSLNNSDVTIAVKIGTTGEMFVDEHCGNAKVLRLDQTGACVIEVSQGKADAFIYDQSTILKYAEQHPDTTRAISAPIQIESWVVGIRKGNDELREQVNEFLKKFREEGGFDRLAEKHLAEQKKRFDAAGIPYIF